MRALLLVIHGTKDRTGLAEIRAFARKVQTRLKPVRVEFALLAPGRRSLSAVVRRLRREGIRQINILPFLLFSGSHVRRDIPRMVAGMRSLYPELNLRLARHIGPSEAAVKIATDRWKEISRG